MILVSYNPQGINPSQKDGLSMEGNHITAGADNLGRNG